MVLARRVVVVKGKAGRGFFARILTFGALLWIAATCLASRNIHRTLLQEDDEANKSSLPVGVGSNDRKIVDTNVAPMMRKGSFDQNDELGISRFFTGPYKDVTRRKHIKKILGCNHTSEGVRPVYTEEEWIALRVAYQRAVGKERSTIDPLSREKSALVPLYVKHTQDRGRGVFAAKPIKKGQAIYTSRFDGWFENFDSYRVFLGLVPPQSVCDVMEWSFKVKVKNKDGEEGYFRVVELDEGALSNGGGSSDANARDEKLLLEADNSTKPISFGVPFTYVATKDIGADEEILSSYSDHSHVHEYAGKIS